MKTSTLILLSMSLAWGCGDKDDGPDDSVVEADTDTDTDTDSDSDADLSWTEMNRAQREQYMTTTVTPRMKAEFQAFAPGTFGDFQCQRCHGHNMEDLDYAMPNGLYPLDEAELPYSESSNPHEAQYGAFMEDTVLPLMADLLDMEPGELTCFACHDRK